MEKNKLQNKLEAMQKVLATYKTMFLAKVNCGDYYAVSEISEEVLDEVLDDLVKHFDMCLAVDNVLAYLDYSINSDRSCGYILTGDGIYVKKIGFDSFKADYISYKDIKKIDVDDDKLHLITNVEDFEDVEVYSSDFNASGLKIVLQKLISLQDEYGEFMHKETGKVKELDIPDEKLSKVKKIIASNSKQAALWAGGLAQIPFADAVPLSGLQIKMVMELGSVFDLDISERAAKGIIGALATTFLSRQTSGLFVGRFPIAGNLINGRTAAKIIESVGWLTAKHFAARWRDDKKKGRYEGMKEGAKRSARLWEEEIAELKAQIQQIDEDSSNNSQEYRDIIAGMLKDLEQGKANQEELINQLEPYVYILAEEHPEVAKKLQEIIQQLKKRN